MDHWIKAKTGATPPHRVRFKGQEYWLLDDPLGLGSDTLSPLSHFNAAGDMNATIAFAELGYAIVRGNDVIRSGKIIGSRNEIKPVMQEV